MRADLFCGIRTPAGRNWSLPVLRPRMHRIRRSSEAVTHFRACRKSIPAQRNKYDTARRGRHHREQHYWAVACSAGSPVASCFATDPATATCSSVANSGKVISVPKLPLPTTTRRLVVSRSSWVTSGRL